MVVVDLAITNLLQKKRDAEIEYHRHNSSRPMGMTLEQEVRFDVENNRLFLLSLEADANYDNAIRDIVRKREEDA